MYERSGERPLSYSRWHRTVGMPNERIADVVRMVDVDGLEWCRWCYAPLALIETASDALDRRNKSTSVLVKLARAAGIPAYVLLYTVDDDAERAGDWGRVFRQFRVRQIYPADTGGYVVYTPAQVADLLIDIHLGDHAARCPHAETISRYVDLAGGR